MSTRELSKERSRKLFRPGRMRKSHIIELRKVKMVMMPGLLRMNTSVMILNASVLKLIKQ